MPVVQCKDLRAPGLGGGVVTCLKDVGHNGAHRGITNGGQAVQWLSRKWGSK